MKNTIGSWRAWALVVGITIGNGIFMLPAYLAPFGKLSVLGWLLSAGGTITIALLLGHLSKKMPLLGGPYVYTRAAFGKLPGFIVAWGYWISVWTAVGAGGVAFAGYLSVLIPSLVSVPYLGPLVALTAIWVVTAINISGTKSAGNFQLVTTLLKILPLFLIAAGGLVLGDIGGINSEPSYEGSYLGMYSSMILIVMWAFVGIEGVTVPADDIKNPEKTIPRALILGTITVAIIYLLTTVGVMAVIPTDELAISTSPISDAAAKLFGRTGAIIITIGALISIIGSMNGNAWMTGSTSKAIAKDQLFPHRFAITNSKGSPAFGLLVSALLASLMIVLNYSGGLVKIYSLLFKLSTLGTLLPYLGSSLAQMYFQYKNQQDHIAVKRWDLIVAIGAFGFVLFALFGTTQEELIWGCILILVGFVVYGLQTRKKK